jgi:AAA+ superfamily predicted ATPase
MILPKKTALTAHPGAMLVQGATTREREQVATKLALSRRKRLLRVDLIQVVGKYIGETEKNLQRLLVLGKRTTIADSHSI